MSRRGLIVGRSVFVLGLLAVAVPELLVGRRWLVGHLVVGVARFAGGGEMGEEGELVGPLAVGALAGLGITLAGGALGVVSGLGHPGGHAGPDRAHIPLIGWGEHPALKGERGSGLLLRGAGEKGSG